MGRYTALFTGEDPQGGTPPQDEEAAGYRLLIVDDEVNVLKALRRVFHQEKNYEVVTATSGEEALQRVEQERFHLVISDFLMPGMDGGTLLRRIKEVQPGTIRIMLTGHADVDAVMGAVKEGAVYRFILKPWNDDDLRVTVGLALEQYDLRERNQRLSEENQRRRKEVGLLSKMAATNRSQLAIMLHKKGLLTDEQLQELYKVQQNRREPVFKLLQERDWVDEQAIRQILRRDFLVEDVALAEFSVELAAAELVPRSYCEHHLVVPLKIEDRRILVAVADPLDDGLKEDLQFVTGLEVRNVMADAAAIRAKIEEVYGEADSVTLEDLQTVASAVDPFESVEVVIDEEEDVRVDELLRSTEEPPAIRLVNAILIEAVRLGASDIHIQPRTKHVVVRLRLDGILHDKIFIPHNVYPSLVSRIKVMAELDIAERRRPQDGRVTVKTPFKVVDLRISTLPMITGEKVVMRVLDRNASIQHLDAIGFADEDLEKVLAMVNKPQGIILATGPTGSGKTTTLYSLLQHNVSAAKNYVTIEDPVEFFLDTAGQVAVKEKVGLTFPVVLRSILRQDPDVILLGEIRDFETAEVAFHAALTGHLVFSTLHTNSAAATIARLMDLGLKPFIVASALEGIIAQRLVRRICPNCRTEAEPDPEAMRLLGPLFDPDKTPVFKGAGCNKCGLTGYKGRIGIFEVLAPDAGMRELIARGATLFELEEAARDKGVTTLLEDGRRKVIDGMTTPEEILRVLGSQLEL